MKACQVAFIGAILFLTEVVIAEEFEKEEILITSKNNDEVCIGLRDNMVEREETLLTKECDEFDETLCWNIMYKTAVGGYFHIMPCSDSSLCVEVFASTSEAGLRLKLEDCKSISLQKFTFNRSGNNELTPKDLQNLCATSENYSTNKAIELESCTGLSHQAWKFKAFLGESTMDESRRECRNLSFRESQVCRIANKGSEQNCRSCCNYLCQYEVDFPCRDCESQCLQANEFCIDESKRECQNLSFRESQVCRVANKGSEQNCRSCCNYLCRYEVDFPCSDCVGECVEAADDCNEPSCKNLSKRKAEACLVSKKGSKRECERCCANACNDLDFPCNECYETCRKDADRCYEAKCQKLSWSNSQQCLVSNKKSTSACRGCCRYLCDQLKDPCSRCIEDCIQAADDCFDDESSRQDATGESKEGCKNLKVKYVKGCLVSNPNIGSKKKCEKCCDEKCTKLDSACDDCKKECRKEANGCKE